MIISTQPDWSPSRRFTLYRAKSDEYNEGEKKEAILNLEYLDGFRDDFSEYTELRYQKNSNLRISLLNGDIVANTRNRISGVSARVYAGGVWGFSASPDTAQEDVRTVIRAATRNAQFLDSRENRNAMPLAYGSARGYHDFSTTQQKAAPKEMTGFLREIDSYLKKSYPDINARSVTMANLDMEKALLTSEGSRAYSMIPRALLIVSLTLDKGDGPVDLFDVYGGFGQYEDNFGIAEDFSERLDQLYVKLKAKAEGIYPEAGEHDVIMDADLAGILAHEAIGHTTEADIVLGGSVAGDYLNKEVASPLVSLTDFAHTSLGRQCPVPVYVDDEGTEAEDVPIIENGVLKSYLFNKETALHFGFAPTGNARASEYSDEPLIRMRNTAILPGKDKLEDMISSIDHGYYLVRASNGQADTTSEFMFGVVMGYEIKNGKIGKALKNTTISGVAFEMLKTVSMVSDEMSWSCAGMCGKKQAIPVGMGGPAVKCRIKIGGK